MKKYLAVILALLLIISSVSACEKASTEPETEHTNTRIHTPDILTMATVR